MRINYFLWTLAIGVSIIIVCNLITCEPQDTTYDSTTAKINHNETLIHRIKTNGDYELSEIERQFPKTGQINTFVDGYDVELVNLWSTATDERQINASLKKGTKVRLLKYGQDYILICKASDPSIWGWCMMDFIKLD